MPPIGVLVMAYGGPDSLEQVEPYLLDVRGSRATPAHVVEEVRERYRRIGGRSPILERTRDQAAAIEAALNGDAEGSRGPGFRAFVGMRHWHPFIAGTLSRMAAEGISRAVGLVMAPHYSRLSVGVYLGKVEEARSEIEIAPIERWHLLPGYLEALEGGAREALGRFAAPDRERVPVVFTAHSLPQRILEWDDPYPRELRETAAALADRLGGRLGEPGDTGAAGRQRFQFAYQSAAMTPDPWLGPDAGELIERFASERCPGVVLAPIGFVCEHVEILYDIDVVFREQAARRGLRLERSAMLNAAPAMIGGLAMLIRERARQQGWL